MKSFFNMIFLFVAFSTCNHLGRVDVTDLGNTNPILVQQLQSQPHCQLQSHS